MKKIRLLSLFLVALLLVGALVLLTSCREEEEPPLGAIAPSEQTIEVDLTGYTVVYGKSQGAEDYTATVRDQFNRFVSRLSVATGVNLKLKQAARTDPDPTAKEILIGATEREESIAAQAEIRGEGFMIKVLENKIVIVGTGNLYTLRAMDYFLQTYAEGKEKVKTLTLPETVWANELTGVVLADSTYTSKNLNDVYTYVYKDGLGMVPSPYANLDTDVSVPSYNELPMTIANGMATKMAELAKISKKYFPVGTDISTKEKEVLVGITGRAESKQALQGVSEAQYVIAVCGERVVLNAWSVAVLNRSTAAYYDLIAEATVTDAQGNVRVVLPRDFRLVGDVENVWPTDFPKPEFEGVDLYNTMDNNDGSLQYLYRGTGVNKSTYNAYCQQLKEAGYTELQSTYAEDSIFKFFRNKTKDSFLYVAYNAYAHKDDYGAYNDTIIKQIDNKVITPYDFQPEFRIVSSTLENSFFPEEKLLTPQNYTYKTPSAITAMPLYSTAVGHCYIVTLEDGSFIVYDGGSVTKTGSREQDRIWNLLCALHEDIWGKAPTREEPIRIAAWILSHGHSDHYIAFTEMLKTYGSTGKIKMDYMIANLPSEESYYGVGEVGSVLPPDTIKSLQRTLPDGFTLIKPHTGMKFYIRNVELETITTWEDLNPVKFSNNNDTNTVLRMTFFSKIDTGDTTMMWLGDANRLQSRFMCATFGDYLKADMSTVAHHGNAGCEIELYEMIDPHTMFWTHNVSGVQSYLNPATKRWMHEVDQYFAYELESVERIFANGGQFVASEISKGEVPPTDGYWHITFNGVTPDFENVEEWHFTFEKKDGKWVTTDVSVTALAHTDISGGAAAFHKNTNSTMTFASDYMVKCDKACPTGEHTH